MIKIDGSIGEGGGQVFRNSVAYSAITLKPLRITNIRANRSPSGLKPQHLTALRLIKEITNAEVKGDEKGSEEVKFSPKEIKRGKYSADTGTAASLTLILQAVLPITLFSEAPIKLRLKGGTDVKWSPPIDAVRFVLLPYLRTLRVNCEIDLVRRGHYPRGGGIVKIATKPIKKALKPVKLKNGEVNVIKGRSHCVSLPKHVAERQAKAARSKLNSEEYTDTSIRVEWYKKSEDPHFGPGSAVVLWAKGSDVLLEADNLGEKGKPAEKVGKEAAKKLLTQIKRGGTVDVHHTDQLIPYMVIANGESVLHSSEISSHTLTAIKIAEKFFNVNFRVKGEKGESGILFVEGLGLT